MRRFFFTFIVLSIAVQACSKAPESASSDARSEKDRQAVAELLSVGYLSGYRPPDERATVVPRNESLVAPGHTLITSGHSATAQLLDHQGKVIHSWAAPYEDVFPDHPVIKKHSKRDISTYWRRAVLLPGGELLAIYEGLGLVKLDRSSKILWARFNRAHHDLEVLADGSIIVLTRQAERRDGHWVLVDYLSYLGADGSERNRVSILDAVSNSPFRQEILRKKSIAGDLLHSNSLQILDGTTALLPGIEAGDVLVSLRNVSALAVISPHTRRVRWAFRGEFRRQHYARVEPRGVLVLFDNMGARTSSRVLRYEWPAMKLLESIGRLQNGVRFFSRTLGMAQPLPNSNMLIVESEAGRLLEVTPDRKIVWEFVNPQRVTVDGRQLVAAIADAYRYGEETKGVYERAVR